MCHVCYVCHGCAMGVQWECGALSVCSAWWECVCHVCHGCHVPCGCAMGVQGAECVQCVLGVCVCVSRVSWVCNGCAGS